MVKSAHLDYQDLLAPVEQQVRMVFQAHQGSLVFLDLLVPRVHQVPLVRQDHQVSAVPQDLTVLLVHQVHQVLRVILVRVEPWERQDQKARVVLLGLRGNLEQWEPQALRVLQVEVVHQELLVHQVQRAQQGHQVRLDHLGLQDLKDR